MLRLVLTLGLICLALTIVAAPVRALWSGQPCHADHGAAAGSMAHHDGQQSAPIGHHGPEKAADLCARWCALQCASLVVAEAVGLDRHAVFATATWRLPAPRREGLSPEPDDPPPRFAA